MGTTETTIVPAIGSQVATELAAAGIPVPCPHRGRSIDVHHDGTCPDCGRPWPEHEAA